MPEIWLRTKCAFRILAGDQIYGDEVEVPVRNEPDLRKRQDLYLGVYREILGQHSLPASFVSLPSD